MDLHSERSGAPDAGRLILLHGFAQTCRCWAPLDADLGGDREIVRIDAPGHGLSAAVRADLPTAADLVARTGGPGTYVGYSMGARLALHVALRHQEILSGLALIAGTPGIEDPAERQARRRRDREAASRIRTHGVEAFLDGWFDQPLFATLPPDARFLAERRRNTAEGLASSLELAGTGSQSPLWEQLPELDVPVLVVAGGADERYAATADRMAAAIGPNASAVIVPGAGHAVHLERPAEVGEAVRSLLGDV